MMSDLPLAFLPSEFRVKWVTLPWEAEQAHALRRAVFCEEQGIFAGDDRDAVDERAQLLVALSCVAGLPDQVVGTVRIHAEGDADDGLWFGSRLAVDPAWRNHARLGVTLIRLAVCSAHALGCRTFRAHVQSQNVPLFERLDWHVLHAETLLGRPHHLMQAKLASYPPCRDPHAGFSGLAKPSKRQGEPQ
ncbi:GNAT family N-acetyltransferase [Massilia sp. YIM B02763]|uniref:MSMEG_0567/Sll0786 family nitrogen starvation N-acetyltransferase n=1 Tax=Massilia sp. YIM B02763 TaxID=3050130 RepID=UPI0025B6337B|nr:MSMEG_0567/Sll0786 family nitrogen starvation N-acetyltransferase [Massilia sp. YIM B02763]MDN4054868.1 GNAT family N-acetyltransferase [Massilia sp. YIM B02763]